MSEPATVVPKPMAAAPDLDTIRVLGRLLDDLERLRIMTSNRIGALERERGEALPHLYAVVEPLTAAEHIAERELIAVWRKHPLASWAKSVRGLGEKSIARLIAEVGSPAIGSKGHWEGEDAERRWVIDETFERSVSQLWAYCGVGDPARNRIPKDAVQGELLKRGKPRAKKQLWLIASSMLKAGNREVYDLRRAETAERTHESACPPCHAKVGDPWKDGHKHTDALRIVAKEFLVELWRADRELLELSPRGS